MYCFQALSTLRNESEAIQSEHERLKQQVSHRDFFHSPPLISWESRFICISSLDISKAEIEQKDSLSLVGKLPGMTQKVFWKIFPEAFLATVYFWTKIPGFAKKGWPLILGNRIVWSKAEIWSWNWRYENPTFEVRVWFEWRAKTSTSCRKWGSSGQISGSKLATGIT